MNGQNEIDKKEKVCLKLGNRNWNQKTFVTQLICRND